MMRRKDGNALLTKDWIWERGRDMSMALIIAL